MVTHWGGSEGNSHFLWNRIEKEKSLEETQDDDGSGVVTHCNKVKANGEEGRITFQAIAKKLFLSTGAEDFGQSLNT